MPEFDGSILFVGVGLFAAIFLLKKQKGFPLQSLTRRLMKGQLKLFLTQRELFCEIG
jgi:hypothetical protein